MKKIIAYIPLMLLIVFGMAVPVQAAEMEDYCIVPPYVKRNLKPNIMIIMDNSLVGGQAAYNTGVDDGLARDGIESGMFRYYGYYGGYDENGDAINVDGDGNPIESYPDASGLFNQKYLYHYSGTRFEPVMPGDAANSAAVFEGNLLNWATTSMYDIIQAILVGGKSASRQANAHTLISDNSGLWDSKLYHYTGTNDVEYVCEFRVNEGGSGDLEIWDSLQYFNDLGQICGLILDPPVGPKPEFTWLGASNETLDDGTAYADASSAMGAGLVHEIKATVGVEEFSKTLKSVMDSKADVKTAGLKKPGFNIFNSLLGLLATEAYAANPNVFIITPDTDGAILPKARVDLEYSSYTPQASSAGDQNFTWTVTGLPAGMIFTNAASADGSYYIGGTPSEVGEFTITFYVINDAAKDDSLTASLTVVEGIALRLVNPLTGDSLRDGFRGEYYKHKMLAAGGSGLTTNYLWGPPKEGGVEVLPLPDGYSYNRNGGIIDGTNHTVQVDTTFPLSLWVKDKVTGEQVDFTTTITIRAYPLRIINERSLENLPIAELGKAYDGPTVAASGGFEPYDWSADGLPDGLSINGNGKIVGTVNPDVALIGTHTVEITVTDATDPVEDTVYIYIEVAKPDGWDVEIVWPNAQYYDDEMGIANLGSYRDGVTYTPLNGGFGKALAVGGDPTDYTWTISQRLLDLGLRINSVTGVLYGALKSSNIPECVSGQGCAIPGVLSVVSRGYPVDLPVVINTFVVSQPFEMVYPDSTTGTTYAAPDGIAGSIYNGFALITEGSNGPTTCRIESGTLPAGLSFNDTYCSVEGTVNAFASPGVYPVEVGASDDGGATYVSGKVSITIHDAEAPRIVNLWHAMTLGWAYQGRYYEVQPIVEGGIGPYKWTSNVSTTHPGLTIDEDTGLISGVPTTSRPRAVFTLTVTDALGHSSTEIKVGIIIQLEDLVSFVNAENGDVLPPATVSLKYIDFAFTAVGGVTSGYEYYMRRLASDPVGTDYSKLPDGMWLDPVSGLLAGIPLESALGTHTFRVCAKTVGGLYGACRVVSMDVVESDVVLNSKAFNLKICASDDFFDCKTVKTDAPAGYSLKEGLLQNYWNQAQFGLLSFAKQTGAPGIDICLPANNEENFFTAVENANPADLVTPLIDGEHKGITLFINSNAADNSCQDVFEDDTSPCRNNFILMLTSGEGADNPPNPTAGTPEVFSSLPVACEDLTSNLAKNACYGWERDNRPDVEGDQKISTYIVNIMGNNGDILSEAALNAGGIYYYATNPNKLRSQIEQALKDIIKRATSGTAASVLASGKGSGANIIQAIYYPRKRFKDSQTKLFEEIMWIGKLSGFWYYVDPFYTNSDIREESEITHPAQLNLVEDYIIQSFYNSTSERVEAERYQDTDSDGSVFNDNGTTTAHIDTIAFEDVNPLWEAGKMLWARDLDAKPRDIYVNMDDSVGMTPFTDTLASDVIMQYYLNVPGDADKAADIINFVNGEDIVGLNASRSRTVKVDIDGDGETNSPGEDVARVWKLGDILNSSPVIVPASSKINRYGEDYDDQSYPDFTRTEKYTNRGMVYAGGNDGMLHAFKLGYLSVVPEADVKAKLFNSPGYENDDSLPPLGHEQWAFIPKNVLPYLKYTLREDYCHIYMVDLTVQFVDVSLCETQLTSESDETDLGNQTPASLCNAVPEASKLRDSWRTVLLGGLSYGGSCKPYGYDCAANSIDTNGDSADGTADADDCVVSPHPIIGTSSYFALDITDDMNPKFMWEFTHPDLGYSVVSPTVVRFGNDATTKDTLGKWYAVIGSGPTGPIDKESNQFVGASDQPLKLFVLDIRTGELVGNALDTGVDYAFASQQGKISIDTDGDYLTDAIYIEYTNRCSGAALDNGAPCPVQTWRNGGILRVVTHEDIDPANWTISKLIDNIGPVSTRVAKQYDYLDNEQWVFFGTGRYLYERVEPWTAMTNAVADDHYGLRNIFAIKDPCTEGGNRSEPYNPPTCDTTVSYFDLEDRTAVPGGAVDPSGWRVSLDEAMIYTDMATGTSVRFGAERVLTAPRINVNTNILFLTTFKPYADECAIGGETYMWAMDARTGTPPGYMKGVAIMQVSTGNITKIDLSKDFTEKDGRRTAGTPGVAAKDPPKFSDPGPSVNKMLHIIERKQ